MTQYINKSALVAEIERVKEFYENIQKLKPVYESNIEDCNDLLSFIDTLETKEVDLEEEIKNRIDSLSNLYCYMEDLFNGKEEEGIYPIPEKVTNELFEFAKYFYVLGLNAQKGG